MVNGEPPESVPMLVPLSKNCTDTIDDDPVGDAFTVTGIVDGEKFDAIVDPLVGVTNEIVGVANAVVAVNSAMRTDAAVKIRRRKVFMSSGATKSLRTTPRPRFGAGWGHDGWVLKERIGRS
jgi:hypothetical protein